MLWGLALQCFYNYNAAGKNSGSTSVLLPVIGGASGSGLTLVLVVVISVALVMHFRRRKNRKQNNHSCM